MESGTTRLPYCVKRNPQHTSETKITRALSQGALIDWKPSTVPGTSPKWMVLDRYCPVLHPDLRPLDTPLDGGRFATSVCNDLYRRLSTP